MVFLNQRPRPLLLFRPKVLRLTTLSWSLLLLELLSGTYSGVKSWRRSLMLFKGRELGFWFPLILVRMWLVVSGYIS